MNNKVDLETRLRFRDWLRSELRELDFYQRRGDHYLIREFAKYCVEHFAPIDEASLGRYLRDEDPVLPTPERCRALARVFGYAPVKVLVQAGYLEGSDLFPPLPKDASTTAVADEVASRKSVVAQATKSSVNIVPLEIIVTLLQESVKELEAHPTKASSTPHTQPAPAAKRARAKTADKKSDVESGVTAGSR
jgi:hypothetical protein